MDFSKELFAVDKSGNIKHWVISTSGDHILVCHGRFGGKMQLKTTVAKPKNVGKANETTAEEQAFLEAQSKYNKQLDKCYRPSVEEARGVGEILPMLAHDYTKVGHRISWPCYVSPKLDGLRCIAEITHEGVILHSRGGKTYDCPEHLKKEIIDVSERTGFTKLDGELYIHGLPLQNIVSAAKRPNKDTSRLEFHVFDIPVSDVTWETRHDMLSDVTKVRTQFIKVVPNILVNNEISAQILLNRFINDGYEGMMLRNVNGLYEFNHRSHNLQKWKLMQDAEAYVTHVEKDLNEEGVLVCQMKGTKNYFKCKMRGGHDFRKYDSQIKLLGKWITYKYQALTNDGLPQFPVGLYVRECDSEGNPIE